MKRLIIALAAATALTACDPPSPPQEYVFYCVDENELVEQHVGVAFARHMSRTESWIIRYVDGNESYYHQPPGETCQIRPAVVSIE